MSEKEQMMIPSMQEKIEEITKLSEECNLGIREANAGQAAMERTLRKLEQELALIPGLLQKGDRLRTTPIHQPVGEEGSFSLEKELWYTKEYERVCVRLKMAQEREEKRKENIENYLTGQRLIVEGTEKIILPGIQKIWEELQMHGLKKGDGKTDECNVYGMSADYWIPWMVTDNEWLSKQSRLFLHRTLCFYRVGRSVLRNVLNLQLQYRMFRAEQLALEENRKILEREYKELEELR